MAEASDEIDYNQAYKFRIIGEEKFGKGANYGALCSYNQSLLCSKKCEAKQLMALTYGLRSTVYFKVNQYERCLNNINLAKLSEYPAHQHSKLELLENHCRDSILKQQQHPVEDPRNFFKLSYPANQKIPFIVNCLELREDQNCQLGIFTKHNLKAGDIIAIEEPVFNFMDSFFALCSNCTKQNMLNLIPGDDESKLRYLIALAFCNINYLF